MTRMESNKRLEVLRQVVHNEPSKEGWATLCEVMEQMGAEELVVAREYLLPHLASWPVDLRRYRCAHVEAWTESPPVWWFAVASLSLSYARVGVEGAKALAQSPCMATLVSLDLRRCSIGDEGAKALAQSPYLGRLTHLDLTTNGLGGEGGRALLESPLGQLDSLILAGNRVGHKAWEGKEGTLALALSYDSERGGPLVELHVAAFPEARPLFGYCDDVHREATAREGLEDLERLHTIEGQDSYMWLSGDRRCALFQATGETDIAYLCIDSAGEFCAEVYHIDPDGEAMRIWYDDFVLK
ncbi:MAG: hypothetical protein AAFS10_05065 [Myxococcota bacterium]